LEQPVTDLLKNSIFLDETAAREWLEARVWASGRVCPHCGNADQDKITKLEGKAHRPGVYQCNESECRQQFTVTVNTVFERSKIPLTKWLAALFLMTASKKGISAHQVHRMLGISYKSTWFLMHRLREAMREGGLTPPMGNAGGVVEVDETYIGRIKGKAKPRAGVAHSSNIGEPNRRATMRKEIGQYPCVGDDGRGYTVIEFQNFRRHHPEGI
jgi:transposase-like protein